MSILDLLYFVILGVNLIVSIVVKTQWKHFYYIYFLITMGVEIITIYFHDLQRLYNFLDIFSMVFFYFLFRETLIYQRIVKGITISLVIFSVYLMVVSKTSYSIYTGIVFCLFSIFLSLSWFHSMIASGESETLRITDRGLFWISSSLLMWSVFYLFRMTPMYWFNNRDPEFLYTLKYIFQIATIVSYGLFLKGLISKQL